MRKQMPNKLSARCTCDEHFGLSDRQTGLCKIIAHNKNCEIVTKMENRNEIVTNNRSRDFYFISVSSDQIPSSIYRNEENIRAKSGRMKRIRNRNLSSLL